MSTLSTCHRKVISWPLIESIEFDRRRRTECGMAGTWTSYSAEREKNQIKKKNSNSSEEKEIEEKKKTKERKKGKKIRSSKSFARRSEAIFHDISNEPLMKRTRKKNK